MFTLKVFNMSAVYTGIKKPESFSHSGFLLKVARQLPLNTPKNPNRKTHLRSVIFWNSAEISLVFCQCKRSLQSRRYYSGFWSRGTWSSAESPDRGPRRNAHYTSTVKGREKSRMRDHLPKSSVLEIRVFGRACVTSLYLWPYTRVVRITSAGRGRVIPLKVTYHVTKNPNNTGEIGVSVDIGKKPVKFRLEFQKITLGEVGFSIQVFWSV